RGDAVGGGRGGQRLPPARPLSQREGAVGRLLEPELAPSLPPYKMLTPIDREAMKRVRLAAAVQAAPEDRQAEAETLFEQFCAEFDGKQRYHFQQIEEMLRDLARDQLNELQFRAVGRPCPELQGVDLEGRPISLS